MRTALLALAALVSSPAFAFTPESGFWWNPAESGRGYSIEIQDNFLFFAGYLYTPAGAPIWYTAHGLMQGNATFTGQLTSASGGQCITCTYRAPQVQVGAGGPVTISFDTEIGGRLTWAGGTIPIQRFDYYYTRNVGDNRNDVLRGEWHMVLDYSSVSTVGTPTSTDYFADVLIFDRLNTAVNPRQTLGCRALNTAIGRCTTGSRTGSGFYNSADLSHFIVIDNSVDTFAVYVGKLGTTQFDGIAKICSKNLTNLATQCIANTAITSRPVRGFRSASYSFVNTGVGPNSAVPVAKLGVDAKPLPMLDSGGLSNAEVKSQTGIDLAKVPVFELNAVVDSLR